MTYRHSQAARHGALTPIFGGSTPPVCATVYWHIAPNPFLSVHWKSSPTAGCWNSEEPLYSKGVLKSTLACRQIWSIDVTVASQTSDLIVPVRIRYASPQPASQRSWCHSMCDGVSGLQRSGALSHGRANMEVNQNGFLICPKCRKKTNTKVLPHTRLKAFPLYCNRCREEFIIDHNLARA